MFQLFPEFNLLADVRESRLDLSKKGQELGQKSIE